MSNYFFPPSTPNLPVLWVVAYWNKEKYLFLKKEWNGNWVRSDIKSVDNHPMSDISKVNCIDAMAN